MIPPGRDSQLISVFGDFHRCTKGGSGKTILKETIIGPAVLASYYPMFNLSFVGKEVKRAVAKQLQVFLDYTSLLDSFQSSFHPSYGTEGAGHAHKLTLEISGLRQVSAAVTA